MKSRNPKNADQRYFDLDEISIVDKAGEKFEDFIYAYAEYVVYRLKNISGKYVNIFYEFKHTVLYFMMY